MSSPLACNWIQPPTSLSWADGLPQAAGSSASSASAGRIMGRGSPNVASNHCWRKWGILMNPHKSSISFLNDSIITSSFCNDCGSKTYYEPNFSWLHHIPSPILIYIRNIYNYIYIYIYIKYNIYIYIKYNIYIYILSIEVIWNLTIFWDLSAKNRRCWEDGAPGMKPKAQPRWHHCGNQPLDPHWIIGSDIINIDVLVGGDWNMFYDFPNSWDDDPIWRTHIFAAGVGQPPIRITFIGSYGFLSG